MSKAGLIDGEIAAEHAAVNTKLLEGKEPYHGPSFSATGLQSWAVSLFCLKAKT